MKGIILAAVLASAACASSQQVQTPPPPAQVAFDPVGTWDFTTDVQGTAVRGLITLRRNDEGALVGVVMTDMTGEIPLQRVTFEGRRAEARSNLPDGMLVMRLEFLEDERITGGWELGDMTGALTGQRKPPTP